MSQVTTDEYGLSFSNVFDMSIKMSPQRPRVIVSSTASLDGRVTFTQNELLLGPEVRRRWHALWPPDVPELIALRSADIQDRYAPTVFLEGSGSFVPYDAEPVDGLAGRHDPASLRRDWLPRSAPRWFVVVDSRGRVPWSFIGNAEISLLVLVSARTPLPYLALLQSLHVPYLLAGTEQVDLRVALEKLQRLIGAQNIVSDGGGGINGALLRHGLVDELQIIWFPALVGGTGTPSVFDGEPLTPQQSPLVMAHCSTVVGHHGSIWSRYENRTGATGCHVPQREEKQGDE